MIKEIGADFLRRVEELPSLALVVFRQFDICFPTAAQTHTTQR